MVSKPFHIFFTFFSSYFCSSSSLLVFVLFQYRQIQVAYICRGRTQFVFQAHGGVHRATFDSTPIPRLRPSENGNNGKIKAQSKTIVAVIC